MIYKSKKSKKWKGSLLLTPIALLHTPHLDSHKHPRTDGGVHTTTQAPLLPSAPATMIHRLLMYTRYNKPVNECIDTTVK